MNTSFGILSLLGESCLPGTRKERAFLLLGMETFYLIIYLFLAVRSLCTGSLQLRQAGGCSSFRCRGFSLQSTDSRGHRLQQLQHMSSCGSWTLEHGLSSCGPWAQLFRVMWNLPGPGIEPVSSTLAGGFLSTVPRDGELTPR